MMLPDYTPNKRNCLKQDMYDMTRNARTEVVREDIYNPQTDGATLVATTSSTPDPNLPSLFNLMTTACAALKPTPAVSIAVYGIDTPVAGLVMFQHPPQLGEFQTTSKAPPTKGKVGRLPNVGNFAARPFAPLEHATLLVEPKKLSYVLSEVTRKRMGVGGDARGRAWVTYVRRRARAKVIE